ncbi:PIG-L family deacetylase [Photorhabdus bodei]|uniref:PIG-L family deacetylase n=1 Tax=Photorhabdus bodei TaxID=2029681 RepID=UPI001EFC5B15|nr:PIG-L family deacetylase [Photorhabdus bodei]
MIHLFLSPHLDDVALSAGGLIHKLVSENQKVVVLTFFTEYDENITSHYSHSAHNDNMYTLWISRCIAAARERIPGSIDNYVTGVSECSQQRGNLKDDGYIHL